MIWTVVRLILIEGTSVIQESREIIVDDVQPGETIEIGCELKAPETEGRVKSFWRLHVGEERIAFGDRLWIEYVGPFTLAVRLVWWLTCLSVQYQRRIS